MTANRGWRKIRAPGSPRLDVRIATVAGLLAVVTMAIGLGSRALAPEDLLGADMEREGVGQADATVGQIALAEPLDDEGVEVRGIHDVAALLRDDGPKALERSVEPTGHEAHESAGGLRDPVDDLAKAVVVGMGNEDREPGISTGDATTGSGCRARGTGGPVTRIRMERDDAGIVTLGIRSGSRGLLQGVGE